MRAGGEAPHQVLGRLRFLLQCSECFRRARALPAALCYVPREVQYKICKDPTATAAAAARSLLSVWDSPGPARGGKRAARATIEVRKGGCLRATGEEYCNGAGLWVKLSKEQLEEYTGSHGLEEGWVLAQRFGGGDKLVPVDSVDKFQWQNQTLGNGYKPAASWEQVVDLTYSMRLGEKPRLVEQDEAAVQKFRSVPPGWSYEHDMELGRFLYDHSEEQLQYGDCMTEHVSNIEVSSQMGDCGAANLMSNQTHSFWESDGPPGQHWVQLSMKKGSIVKKLWLVLNGNDNSYIPRRVAVYGGPPNRLQHIRTVLINENSFQSVCILRNMKFHLPVLEIRFLECRDQGYNVRLQGIKIKSFWEWDLILNSDVFQPARLVRYPLLEGVDSSVLYRRAVLIQRFVQILDSVLCYLIPLSEDSIGTFNALRNMKPFLLLSKQSTALIAHCLQSSESTPPAILPKLNINRQLAREHRANPALDRSYRHTVFTQLYEGLRSSKHNRPLDYRWPTNHTQWWECDFVTEGIVDNGGGFRDTLSDVSEELCPSSGNVPVPLPFFVRTSNQILALPALVWKQLAGEEIDWSKDFAGVDAELVKLLEMMEGMDREAFEFMFGKELTYTVVRSDQHVVELIPNGSNTVVCYEDRKEFIRLVQKARLEESKEQIAAMRAGLLCVVPQPVLDLLTWQLMEKKVCGDPKITVSDLRRFVTFMDFLPNDTRIQNFWEALSNFTSEDLSRFLKFVSGRSRLPVQIIVYPDRSNLDAVDLMPQASTCSCAFFLPSYSSAKTCEEMLRYAVYNCVSIDTDRTWDE
ncbi:E3 ubiquitin-protein ligase HECTD3-like isoform 2-T2 [Amazona ochrocephala]